MRSILLAVVSAIPLGACATTSTPGGASSEVRHYELERVSSSLASAPATTSVPIAQLPYGAQAPAPKAAKPVWRVGDPLMQGFIGWTGFTDVGVDLGGGSSIDGDGGDLDEFPLLGGGGQFKLGGGAIDWGLEGIFSFGGRANAAAFAVGGGGAAVAVDVDMLLFELYGGPFVSVFLGDKLRAYVAAGPLLQWVDYDQSGGGFDDSGSGFGTGVYARTGLEFALPSQTFIGFGVRWSESDVDLDNSVGELDIEGMEYMITVTRRF